MTHATTLVVLTLLQLCRAETSDPISGTWFSANTINDGYSPKSISELFTTDVPSFSPTKPIVVLPDLPSISPEPEVTHLSTTSTKLLPVSSTPISNGPEVSHFSTTPSSFFSESTTPIPPISYNSSPPTTFSTTYAPTLDFSQNPSITSQWPFSPSSTVNEALSSLTRVKPIETSQQTFGTSPVQTQPTSSPDFFVVYQNTPKSTQGIPSSNYPTTDITQRPITRPVFTSAPFTSITEGTVTPFISSSLSDSTSRPTPTFLSSTISTPYSTSRTTLVSKNINTSTRRIPQIITQSPLKVVPGPPAPGVVPNLRITVVAPKGSITNVRINPPSTTKAPTTRRTKRPKKNSYDGCLDACRGRKDPICAIPLASIIIDPKTLKGFPSICHLSCHNSFRKDAYEKIVDGRCGRLRTRIISVDNQKKIQREDLNKAEYSVVNNGPRRVVEISHVSP